jgi:hypothetical protein
VHDSFYCVGGAFPRRRCGLEMPCSGDGCDDYETCCDTVQDDIGAPCAYRVARVAFPTRSDGAARGARQAWGTLSTAARACA